MPDRGHVLSFLGGLSESLFGNLRADQLRKHKEEMAQQDFLDEQLLKSIQHPDTTIDQANKVTLDVLQRRAKAAGLKPDEVSNLWQHIVRQVGTVKEQKPGTDAPDYGGMSQDELLAQTRERRATTERPKTIGDVEMETAARKARTIAEATEGSKIRLEQQRGLIRAKAQQDRWDHEFDKMDYAAQIKANAEVKAIAELYEGQGDDPATARAKAQGDVLLARKRKLSAEEALEDQRRARTKRINQQIALAPAYLAIAEKRAETGRMQYKRLLAQGGGKTGLKDLDKIKSYMDLLDRKKAEIDKKLTDMRAKFASEADIEAAFESYSNAAQAIAETAQQLLGDKIVVSGADDGWWSIKPAEEPAAGLQKTSPSTTPKGGIKKKAGDPMGLFQ